MRNLWGSHNIRNIIRHRYRANMGLWHHRPTSSRLLPLCARGFQYSSARSCSDLPALSSEPSA